MINKTFKEIIKNIPNYRKRFTRISMDIASQIYDYMKQNDNMSQKKLAEKLGKKESEISKWLSGNHNFTIETIAKIEDVFNRNILLVPQYVQEDLGIKYETPPSVSVIDTGSLSTTNVRIILDSVLNVNKEMFTPPINTSLNNLEGTKETEYEYKLASNF